MYVFQVYYNLIKENPQCRSLDLLLFSNENKSTLNKSKPYIEELQ